MRSRLYTYFFILTFLGLSVKLVAQQQSTYYIETYNSAGKLLNTGSAVIVDQQGTGATHQAVFAGAATAKAFTADSTIHQIATINALDKLSGIVKFSVDNNLSTAFKPVKMASSSLNSGQSLIHLTANSIEERKIANVKISEVTMLADYGQLMLIPDNVSAKGSLAFDGVDFVGVLLSGINGVNGTMIIPANRIAEAAPMTMGFAKFAGSLDNANALSAFYAYGKEN
jgi:hypothetical protein